MKNLILLASVAFMLTGTSCSKKIHPDYGYNIEQPGVATPDAPATSQAEAPYYQDDVYSQGTTSPTTVVGQSQQGYGQNYDQNYGQNYGQVNGNYSSYQPQQQYYQYNSGTDQYPTSNTYYGGTYPTSNPYGNGGGVQYTYDQWGHPNGHYQPQQPSGNNYYGPRGNNGGRLSNSNPGTMQQGTYIEKSVSTKINVVAPRNTAPVQSREVKQNFAPRNGFVKGNSIPKKAFIPQPARPGFQRKR